MKKVVALVALVGCMVVGNSSFAQDVPVERNERVEKSPIQKAEKLTEKMTENLNLSEDQAQEIKKINVYHIQEMEDIKRKMKALKAEAKVKRKEHLAKVDQVLNDEQKKLHADRIAERKAQRDAKKKECDQKCRPKPE
ncbi:MAG: protein CpxP [Crocinitomix sp.]|jgi:protein CpxP